MDIIIGNDLGVSDEANNFRIIEMKINRLRSKHRNCIREVIRKFRKLGSSEKSQSELKVAILNYKVAIEESRQYCIDLNKKVKPYNSEELINTLNSIKETLDPEILESVEKKVIDLDLRFTQINKLWVEFYPLQIEALNNTTEFLDRFSRKIEETLFDEEMSKEIFTKKRKAFFLELKKVMNVEYISEKTNEIRSVITIISKNLYSLTEGKMPEIMHTIILIILVVWASIISISWNINIIFGIALTFTGLSFGAFIGLPTINDMLFTKKKKSQLIEIYENLLSITTKNN